jgi:hyaluronoglucosaminidase
MLLSVRVFPVLAAALLLSAGAAVPAEAGARHGLPVVSPTPQRMERIGPDVTVDGRVELITTAGTDGAAGDLLATVLRGLGAGHVARRARRAGRP